jgi:DNA-directed RNA polymerase subunit RPC12/RpoP
MSGENISCPSCGHLNPSQAKFCINCGRQLAQKEEVIQENVPDIQQPQTIPPPKSAPAMKPLTSIDKEVLKYLLFVNILLLMLDLVSNQYILIIMRAWMLMLPYIIGLILYIISLYFIVNDRPVSRGFKIILYLSAILGVVGTLIPYILGLTAGYLAYTPMWLFNMIILYKVYQVSKSY